MVAVPHRSAAVKHMHAHGAARRLYWCYYVYPLYGNKGDMGELTPLHLCKLTSSKAETGNVHLER